MLPEPVADMGELTEMQFTSVDKLRLDPLINDAGLATLIVPAVPLVKFTDRLFTKLAVETPKLNDEFETAPELSFTRIEVKPDGRFT
jgi:hypothetical protein